MLRNKHQNFHNYPPAGVKFRITLLNDSLISASLFNEGDNYYGHKRSEDDPNGALVYVVAVVFLWGMSIVMLIASYVRKTRIDKNISLYLKEIQSVRNRSDRQKILQVVHTLDFQTTNPASRTRLGSVTTCTSSTWVASPTASLGAPAELYAVSGHPKPTGCTTQLQNDRNKSSATSSSSRYSVASGHNIIATGSNHHHRMVPQICIQEEDLTDCNLSANEVSSVSDYDPESPEPFYERNATSESGLCTKV